METSDYLNNRFRHCLCWNEIFQWPCSRKAQENEEKHGVRACLEGGVQGLVPVADGWKHLQYACIHEGEAHLQLTETLKI